MQTLFAATWWFGRIAVEQAWQVWRAHSKGIPAVRLMDAVVAGTAAVELDPSVLSVGYGGIPNQVGEVELDAALMEGENLRAGAVGGVRRFVPVIELARRVMEHTPHLMLIGEGAERFALQQGFTPRSLLTEESIRRWHSWFQEQFAPTDVSQARAEEGTEHESVSHDTVGVIGWHQGHLVVACSTSGLAWKMPGRVGDSPIVGAGLYADNEAGAAVCTGHGEEIWRFALASRVVEHMREGASASEACRRVIEFLLRRIPDTAKIQAAVIAVRADGDYGLGATQPDHFEAYFCLDGQVFNAKP